MLLAFNLYRTVALLGGLFAASLFLPAVGLAQSTEFTYQGQLKDGGLPAGGAYDMVFRVFDADVGGVQYGADFPLPGVAVEGGLFTVDLDFGAGVFTASPRWLELEVNGQVLSPRQEVSSAPFAQKCIDAATATYAATAGLAGPWQTDGATVSYVGGNVGIGTAAPAHPLSVAGTIESTVDGFKFPDGTVQATASTGGAGFWSPSGADIFSNNAGNIGIGTAAPLSKLDIAATGDGAELLRLSTERPWVFRQAYTGSGTALRLQPLTGLKNFEITAAGGTNVATFWANDAGPKVGIGTTAPVGTLSVNAPVFGALNIFNSGVGDFTFDGGSDGVFGINNLAGPSGSIDFASNHGMYLRFANTGNVGIGTSAPASKLDIAAAGEGAQLLRFTTERPWIFRQIYSGPSTGLQLYSTSGAKNFEITCSTGVNCATFFTQDAAPRVGIGTTTPTTTLDVNGTTKTKVLQITGADVAEKFPTSGERVEPGTVMEIDPQTPGQLRMARGAYNPRVAGVVSGANNFPAGAILGHMPGLEDAPAIALSGRVWVRCDASAAAIELGNLLTTSETPGHAMTASDREQSHGAVLGKAMSSLKLGERGLVLVLVNLQ